MSPNGSEIEFLANYLLKSHSKLGNWQAVADEFGVPKIIVWRIAKDEYEPMKNSVRLALGLSEITIVRQKRDPQGRYMRKFGD